MGLRWCAPAAAVALVAGGPTAAAAEWRIPLRAVARAKRLPSGASHLPASATPQSATGRLCVLEESGHLLAWTLGLRSRIQSEWGADQSGERGVSVPVPNPLIRSPGGGASRGRLDVIHADSLGATVAAGPLRVVGTPGSSPSGASGISGRGRCPPGIRRPRIRRVGGEAIDPHCPARAPAARAVSPARKFRPLEAAAKVFTVNQYMLTMARVMIGVPPAAVLRGNGLCGR